MTKPIRFGVVGAAVLLVAPVWAQDTAKPSPVRVVTKTLVASEAQKECLSLNNRQRLHYKFRADGPLNFKVSHQEEKEVIDLKRDGTESASGSFMPKKSADQVRKAHPAASCPRNPPIIASCGPTPASTR